MNPYFNRYYQLIRRKFLSITEPYLENLILEDVIERNELNIRILFYIFPGMIFSLFLGIWFPVFLIIGIVFGVMFIVSINSIFIFLISEPSLIGIIYLLPVEKIKLYRTIWFLLSFLPNILNIMFLFIFIIPALMEYGCSKSIMILFLCYYGAGMAINNIALLQYYNKKFRNIVYLGIVILPGLLILAASDTISIINKYPVITIWIYFLGLLSLFLTYLVSQKMVFVPGKERKAKTISSTGCTHRISLLDRFLSSPFYFIVFLSFSIIPFPIFYFMILGYFVYFIAYLIQPIRLYASLPISKIQIYISIIGSCMFVFLPSFLYYGMRGIDMNPLHLFVINNICFYQICTLPMAGLLALLFCEKNLNYSMIESIFLIPFSIITLSLTAFSIIYIWLGMILMLLLILRFFFMIWVTINQSSTIYKKDFMKRGWKNK